MAKRKDIDGRYAFVILVSSFFHNYLAAGMFLAHSILLVEFIEYFDQPKSAAGLGGSINQGMLAFSGFFFGSLVVRFGTRSVTMVCGVLATIGLMTTAFSSNIYMIYVGYGLIGGVGLGGITLSSVVVIQQYFDKRRPTAAGIALMGGSIAAVTFTPLFRLVVAHVGWRSALILHSCLMLQTVVLGATYRPLPKVDKTLPVNQVGNAESDSGIKEASAIQYYSLEDLSSPRSRHDSVSSRQSRDSAVSVKNRTIHDIVVETNAKLYEEVQQNGLSEPEQTSKKTQTCSLCDFSLLKDYVFVLFLLAQSLLMYGIIAMYQFSPSRAVFLDITKLQASLLPSAIGLCSTVGRLFSSCVSNFKWVDRNLYHAITCMSGGIVAALTCLSTTFTEMLVCAGTYGIFLGQFMTLQPTIMVDIVGVKNVAKAQGWRQSFLGLSSITAMPILGALFDVTQSYNLMYVVGGCIQMVAAACMFLVFLIVKIRSTKATKHSSDGTTASAVA